MTKILRCTEVMPGCPDEVRADSTAEVLRLAADHARTVHGVAELDSDTVERVRAAIRDER